VDPAFGGLRRARRLRRAGRELADTAILVITGEKDFEDAIIRPVATYVTELRRLGVTVDWQVIPGMAHAEEPGVEPAPQTPHAVQVDRLAATWFARYLS
jgi:hypothetical protein